MPANSVIQNSLYIMPQKITYLLIFLVSFVYGSAQPTTPRKFPEVKEKYKTLIALKARLDFMLDSLADVKYVEEVAAEVVVGA